jgi:hypothetical protein
MGLHFSTRTLILWFILLAGSFQYMFLSKLSHQLDRKQTLNLASARLNYYERKIQSLEHHQSNLELGPIFYNIYIHDGTPEQVENSLEIIKEQMQQRKWSDPESEIQYTLIGHASNFTSDMCQPCQQRAYLPKGGEVDTLQALWDHCQAYPHQLVTYIHDKGSFHNTSHNIKTRRMATKAALDCRAQLLHKGHIRNYNVCTGNFMILPQYLATANMWTARCDYVQQLLPPRDYSQKLEQMYNLTLFHPLLGESEYACLKPRHLADNHLGRGRFAYERWIWSHPNVNPSVVVPLASLTDAGFPQNWQPHISKAPKFLAKAAGMTQGYGVTSWARLEGRLFEWKYLYAKSPPNASWIWRYYEGYETGTPLHKRRWCVDDLNLF